MKNLAFILCLAFFFSCAKSEEEQVSSAKNLAKYYLTNKECAKARKALLEVDYQKGDEVYVILLSNSYACEAAFSELDFLGEVGVITAGQNQTLGSLTQLSTSNETEPDSEKYVKLLKAVDVLLESGGGSSPSAAQREATFGSIGANEVNLRALFLLMTEMGKFLHFYGNAAGGVKGGQGHHTCFLDYGTADAKDWVENSGETGACSVSNDGSPDLPGPADSSTTKRRLCEGIYLFNNLRDVLLSLDFGNSNDFGSLADVSSALESIVSAAEGMPGGASITAAKNMTSREECDSLSAVDLENWYAYIFETAFP